MQATNENQNAQIGRRTFLKGAGAAAGTAMVGTGLSGSAAAADDDSHNDSLSYYGVQEDSTAPTWALFGGLNAQWDPKVVDVANYISDDPSADEVVLHSTAMSNGESWSSHSTLIRNNLEDTQTMASIEARVAIADAWESGNPESEAYDDALTAIDDYFGRVEKNHIHVVNKILLQNHFIATTAMEDPDITDDFLAPGVITNYTGTSSTESVSWTGKAVETTLTVTGGTEIPVETPEILIEIEDVDGNVIDQFRGGILSDDVYGAYSASSNAGGAGFDIVTQDSETVTLDAAQSIVNVPIDGSEDLPSATPFRLESAAFVTSEISGQAQSVKANYDTTFVGDLYAAMDSGKLDPNDVRGIDGMAQHLAGSDDTSSSAYQFAAASQLDVSRADLSETTSLDVTYSGDTTLEPKPKTQNKPYGLFYGGDVEGKAMQGMLFAEEASVKSGGKYWCDPEFAIADNGQGAVSAVDEPGGMLAPLGTPTATTDIAVDGDTAYVTTPETAGAGSVIETPRDDREQGWKSQVGVNTQDATAVEIAAKTVVSTDQTGGVFGFDPSDGSELWSASAPLAGNFGALEAVGDGIVVVTGTEGAYAALDAGNGSVLWSGSIGSSTSGTGINAIASTDAGEVLLAHEDGTVYARNRADGSQLWTYNHGLGNPTAAAVADGRLAISARVASNPSVFAVYDASPETGNLAELWTDEASGASSDIVIGPDAMYFGARSGDMVIVDRERGIVDKSITVTPNMIKGLAVDLPDPSGMDGRIHGGQFYAAESGDTYQLNDGAITIDSMTDSKGNEITAEQTFAEPDYDSYDTTTYSNYVEKANDAVAEEIQSDTAYDDGGSALGGGVLPGGGGLNKRMVGGVVAVIAAGAAAVGLSGGS